MCLAIPLKVVALQGAQGALCESAEGARLVDRSLIEALAPGDWITVHLGIARERIDAEEARRILDAMEALARVRAGETEVDSLFADLVGREPPRPPRS